MDGDWDEDYYYDRPVGYGFIRENAPIYVFLTIVLIIISIFLYIKLAFPFWNAQPVYHVYDFWRCLYSRPFYIYSKFHPKIRTRFCKPDSVDIVPFVDVTDDQKKAFVNMVQCYSLVDENAMCVFHLENLDTYFSGHIYGSYLSFYKDIHYTLRDKELIKSEKPRGCISSRSGVLYVRGLKENIYWLDHMMVTRDGDGLKIQREMFDTHLYKVGFVGWKGVQDEPIRGWLFRRIGVLLAGIVPLTRFSVRTYEIPNNPGFYERSGKERSGKERSGNEQKRYPDHVILTEINDKNIQKMMDGLEMAQNKFGIFVMTDRANLVELVKKNIIHVFILERLDEVLTMYFFRDTRTMVTEGAVLELVGSVLLKCSVGLFRNGFLDALNKIKKKNGLFSRLVVDNLTDNGLLDWSEWNSFGVVEGAYYTWNLVVPSFGSGFFVLF